MEAQEDACHWHAVYKVDESGLIPFCSMVQQVGFGVYDVGPHHPSVTGFVDVGQHVLFGSMGPGRRSQRVLETIMRDPGVVHGDQRVFKFVVTSQILHQFGNASHLGFQEDGCL